MKKRLLYLLSAVAAMLTSCSDEVVEKVDFLNGNEKTPITVVSNISANTPVTRAADAKWEAGDELLAYIQHVTTTGTSPDLAYESEVTGEGVGPRLAKLTVSTINNDHKDIATNYGLTDASTLGMASGETKLYWDDFSNSIDEAHDLRTANHALMVKYGLCYNGGTPSTALTQTDGTLGWTIATNQSASNKTDPSAFQHSDLLFSPTQTPVAYAHGSGNGITDRDPKLEIPFTHAMSKVTVVVKCDEGFSSSTENFANTSVELQGMNTVATVTAPTATVTPVAGSNDANVKDVTMQPLADGATNMQKSFSALIVPTVMKEGKLLAKIKNVDLNDYDINLTDAVLTTATSPANAWSSQLVTYNAASVTPTTGASYDTTNGGLTKPGVHYMITVTIKKQQIKVEATIQPWENVTAEGVGTIEFSANVVTSTTSGTAITTNGANFNLWRAIADGVNDNYDENTANTGVVDKATTLAYSTSPAGWAATPKIYWPNNSTKYFFRALATYNGTNYSAFAGEDASHTATTDLKINQGTDLVWGTTAAHTGTEADGTTTHLYGKGAAIDPRTGEVPMAFEHAMSKISVKLESAAGLEAVNITGAKISIVNIYDGGTVSLTDGKIVDMTASGTMPVKDFGDMYNSTATNILKEYCVIPQSLTTLEDGTTARTGATTFYTPNDLTVIYDDGTSQSTGGGTGSTYVTSTLEAVYYTSEECKTHNDALSGAISTSTVKTPAVYYTQEEIDAALAIVKADGYVSGTNPDAELIATKTITDVKTPAVTYTETEVDAYNATLPGAWHTTDINYYKTKDGSKQAVAGDIKTNGTKIVMHIMLADKTGYTLELATCKDSTDALIQEWEPGKHYTYTITLGKEEIIFRALIKNWDEKTGTGNATLDWD